MKRTLGACAAILIAFVAVMTLMVHPSDKALAKGQSTVKIEVTFRTLSSSVSEGESCGLLLSPFTSTKWPLGKQVVIRDDTDRIVAKMDLADVFDLTQSHDSQPGTINEKGFCVVTEDVDIADSAFYTFEVEGVYSWTMSRAELEDRDWHMSIIFLNNAE